MHLNFQQVRAMQLAGTVSVPLIFPELGKISARRQDGRADSPALLRVEHRISPRLMIARTFFCSEVALVFIPDDPQCVELNYGRWLAEEQIMELFLPPEGAEVELMGIVYVAEKARTLMQVEVGMTAAESVEYYPPLPGDRSVDHYQIKPTLCCDNF